VKGFSNLKEAKARAKYFLTDAYSQNLGYACVMNEKGECLADFFPTTTEQSK
jgi:hypothetical protein